MIQHINNLTTILADFYAESAAYDLSGTPCIEIPYEARPRSDSDLNSLRIALRQAGYFLSGLPGELPGGVLMQGRVIPRQCIVMAVGYILEGKAE